MTAFVLFLHPILAAISLYYAIEGAQSGNLIGLTWIFPAVLLTILWGSLYRTHFDTVRMQGQIAQLDKQIAEERALMRLEHFEGKELS